jgi:radical SAM superfamily enzyme YgiQ (UPF0313 family)
MAQPKKRDHPLARRQLYLNYGALTLATQLERSGRPSRLVHGGHETPEAVLDRLVDQGLLPSAFPVMLSMPSFYALGWTQAFCRLLRAFDPSGRIIIGGRWVTSPDPDWLGGLIPEADRIVPGLGESLIAGLIEDPMGVCLAAAPSGLPDFGLDHTLVEDFLAYQPSVETSRGCGMGCAFCEERDIPLSRLREPELLAAYMADAQTQYRAGPIRPYLQSSFFVPNPRWASRMREIVEAHGLAIPWRCETRVDAMKPETVEHLAAAGLKVIDLGLETASPTQIGAMNKSPNPDRYLRMASDLLLACRANGVWVKANVLLYGGETARTVDETRAWLDHHVSAIKGVSVGPVVVFGPPRSTAAFMTDLERLGARPVDSSSAATTGITQIHPSAEIDAVAAEAISLDLSRRYMDADAYFDLKAFSYYPRDYARPDFNADVIASPEDRLPFRLEPASRAEGQRLAAFPNPEPVL